jgi:glycosyltransferase involved in cell wall biosynthesis
MTRRLRIVSVCRSLPNPDHASDGVFVANRLAAMHEHADVHVIQPVPYMPVLRRLPTWARQRSRQLKSMRIEHAPMFYVPGVLKTADAMWLARAIGSRIERMHARQPIDLIDAHFGYPEGAACLRVAHRLGIPAFITIRGFENEFASRPGVGPQLVNALREATGCVSVSHSLKELATRLGVADERVRVVHNAIDAGLFHPGNRDAARAELGIDTRQPLVVSVGHLISRKRHHVLIDAFARVRERLPNARLVIMGAPSFEQQYPAQLDAQVAALGLRDHVSIMGNIPPPKVATWLRAADVFALGTAREGCCNAVLEALATGLPVVTTPAGDNAWFVEENVSGHLVPVDDATTMADRVTRALERTDWDRAGISQRLMQQVGSWDRVATSVIEFFKERLGASRLQ